jgi:hypothetical protein
MEPHLLQAKTSFTACITELIVAPGRPGWRAEMIAHCPNAGGSDRPGKRGSRAAPMRDHDRALPELLRDHSDRQAHQAYPYAEGSRMRIPTFFLAFLDGFTPGRFDHASRPGAPEYLFTQEAEDDAAESDATLRRGEQSQHEGHGASVAQRQSDTAG